MYPIFIKSQLLHIRSNATFCIHLSPIQCTTLSAFKHSCYTRYTLNNVMLRLWWNVFKNLIFFYRHENRQDKSQVSSYPLINMSRESETLHEISENRVSQMTFTHSRYHYIVIFVVIRIQTLQNVSLYINFF